MNTYDSSEHSALPQVKLRGCVLYISSKAVRRRRPDDCVGSDAVVGVADGAAVGTGDGTLEAVGNCVGLAVAVGVADGAGVGTGDGAGEAVGLAVIVGIAEGAGDGTGDGELEAVSPLGMRSDPLQLPLCLHSYMYPTPLVATKRNHSSFIGRLANVARETPCFCRAFRLSPSPVASIHSSLSSSR